MVHETGTVVESGPDGVVVEFSRSSACRNCTASGLCLSLGKDRARLKLQPRPDLSPGHRVRVRLPGRKVVWGSLVVFIWPILALTGSALIGYLAAERLGAGPFADFWAVGAGFLGLIISFLIVRRYDRSLERSGRFTPEVIEVVE